MVLAQLPPSFLLAKVMLFVLIIKKGGVDRDKVYRHLIDSGIGVNLHYIPVYRQPYFNMKTRLPGAEQYYKSAISLPIFPAISEKKLSIIGANLLVESLKNIENDSAKFTDQIHSQATYAKKINKNETKINWELDANKIISHIHGLSTNPGAWFEYENERFKVLRVKKSQAGGGPGIVLDENLTVGCKSGSIQILEIQREGKNKQNIKDFLRGKKISKDSILI